MQHGRHRLEKLISLQDLAERVIRSAFKPFVVDPRVFTILLPFSFFIVLLYPLHFTVFRGKKF